MEALLILWLTTKNSSPSSNVLAQTPVVMVTKAILSIVQIGSTSHGFYMRENPLLRKKKKKQFETDFEVNVKCVVILYPFCS